MLRDRTEASKENYRHRAFLEDLRRGWREREKSADSALLGAVGLGSAAVIVPSVITALGGAAALANPVAGTLAAAAVLVGGWGFLKKARIVA